MEHIVASDILIPLEGNAEPLLRELLVSIMPQHGWADCKESIATKSLAMGLTNHLYMCAQEGKEVKVVVRVYGHDSELLIDREHEIRVLKALTATNSGAALLGTFANGIVVLYKPGKNTHPERFADASFSCLIAKEMAKFHKAHLEDEEGEPWLWRTMKSYLATIAVEWKDLSLTRGEMTLSMEDLREELSLLQTEFSSSTSPIVCAHNDLNNLNVLWDESSASISFIDFEYCAPNYAAFDHGNHFCEFAGPELEQQFDKFYPSLPVQRAFLRAYLQEANGEDPTESELNSAVVEANRFAMISHFMWGLWALVQAKHSTIDFDFYSYSLDRLAAYYTNKKRNNGITMLAVEDQKQCDVSQ